MAFLRSGLVLLAMAAFPPWSWGKDPGLPPIPRCPEVRGSKLHRAYVATGPSNQFIYDCDQEIFWLADANLAYRFNFGISAVNPASGAMDFPTAVSWVTAMNGPEGSAAAPGPNGTPGYLGVGSWRLPSTPSFDPTCYAANGNLGGDGNSFGFFCGYSAQGYLFDSNFYNTNPGYLLDLLGIGDEYTPFIVGVEPGSSAVRLPSGFRNRNPAAAEGGPFINLWPSLYWTQGPANGQNGSQTFNFGTGNPQSNVTDNYLFVLPRTENPGAFAGARWPVAGTTLEIYLSGPAKGAAIYDTATGYNWLADASYAASNPFGIMGINLSPPFNQPGVGTIPYISLDGAMSYPTAVSWVAQMNLAESGAGFLGARWQLPDSSTELAKLYADVGYTAGQPSYVNVDYRAGPLTDLQPNLYWACMMNNVGDQNYLQAAAQPCLYDQYPGVNTGGVNMAFTFNFSEGFQGTTEYDKQNFVMVYAVP